MSTKTAAAETLLRDALERLEATQPDRGSATDKVCQRIRRHLQQPPVNSHAELVAAARRCLPDWDVASDATDGQVCCEISCGDVRALIAAIAKAEAQ